MINIEKQDLSLNLVYFGHNRNDAASIRRIESFIDIGIKVTSYMFHRNAEPNNPEPHWQNIDLGYVEHAKLLARIKTLFVAVIKTLRYKKYLYETDIVYARNLDMALLAWLSMSLVRRKPLHLVYECLDVHESLTKQGCFASALRWLERRILARAKLLVVSSPGFIHQYFKPYQQYNDEYYLLENKLYFHKTRINRPNEVPLAPYEDKPIVLVWVGNLRCQETLNILKKLASSASNNIIIRLHGVISFFLIPNFLDQIADISNIEYKGPYNWPHGLEQAYQDADYVWAQELSWKGHNSDWLIPNRIYEASYFGVLSLAVEGTQTATIVKQRQLGIVIDTENLTELKNIILGIDKKELNNRKNRLLNRSEREFLSCGEDVKELINKIIQ